MKQSLMPVLVITALLGCRKQAEKINPLNARSATAMQNHAQQLAAIVVVPAPTSGNFNNLNLTNPYQTLGGETQQGNGYYTNLQSLETGTGPQPNGGSNWIGMDLGWPDSWWENEAWLQANLSLATGPETTNSNLPKLTAAEIALIAQYPVAAYLIYKNVDRANNETKAKFDNKNGLNDKTDAFRHAYFQAINTRDVGAYVALLFANAHESNVPAHLQLEKNMDLYNNMIGISIGEQQYNASNADLSVAALAALNNGLLRRLFPINLADPNFAFTHGITAQTQLVPTP